MSGLSGFAELGLCESQGNPHGVQLLGDAVGDGLLFDQIVSDFGEVGGEPLDAVESSREVLRVGRHNHVVTYMRLMRRGVQKGTTQHRVNLYAGRYGRVESRRRTDGAHRAHDRRAATQVGRARSPQREARRRRRQADPGVKTFPRNVNVCPQTERLAATRPSSSRTAGSRFADGRALLRRDTVKPARRISQ